MRGAPGLPPPVITPASAGARLFAGLGTAPLRPGTGAAPCGQPPPRRDARRQRAGTPEAVRFGAGRFHDLLVRYC
ncbi:hypothetical protein [Streptomyces sp. NPDC041003]|uniref:hypothetical protein n=1 Tax=Streptomyces sp. NPDC041003 TaxID=3155730 RepID=UPI0033D232AE